MAYEALYVLMPHPSMSPDMNPIEKYWRRITQSLHRRNHQPTTEAQTEQAVTEEWDAIPQEWINQLILKHEALGACTSRA
jgi:hypothetical protein